MSDNILAFLHEARACCLEEQEDKGKGSRALSVTLTNIDTALLWRQEDLRLKAPQINECSQKKPGEK